MENALYVGGFEMEQKTAMKISMVSIVGNILLSLFKALAGIVANSGAMISDAIHSASDVFSTIVVIIGIRLSGKESDKEHPYGHERMECVAAILLATILAATGLFIGWSAVEKITVQDDSALAVPGILALVAAVVSIAVKEAMFWYTRAGAKKIDSGYDAEAILGKTDFLDYFIITYLAYQIVGGDKRKGRDYITREQYYEKYNVKDKRNYQQRDNTILKKQEVERNYNSRPYIFQVEYSANGKKHIYRDSNWENVLIETGLLSNSVKFPQTKF